MPTAIPLEMAWAGLIISRLRTRLWSDGAIREPGDEAPNGTRQFDCGGKQPAESGNEFAGFRLGGGLRRRAGLEKHEGLEENVWAAGFQAARNHYRGLRVQPLAVSPWFINSERPLVRTVIPFWQLAWFQITVPVLLELRFILTSWIWTQLALHANA
jgi:hypothetical protein